VDGVWGGVFPQKREGREPKGKKFRHKTPKVKLKQPRLITKKKEDIKPKEEPLHKKHFRTRENGSDLETSALGGDSTPGLEKGLPLPTTAFHKKAKNTVPEN